MKKAVLILGGARSGTSTLAGLASIAGVWIPHWDAPHADNPKGAFEEPQLNELVRQAVAEYQKDPQRREEIVRAKAPAIHSVLETFLSEALQGRCWGFKSALTHWLPELIIPQIAKLGCEVFLLVTWRNPFHTALSLQKHWEHLKIGQPDLVGALGHVAEDIRRLSETLHLYQYNTLRSLPVRQMHFAYERVVDSPGVAAQRIAEHLGLEFDEEDFAAAEEFIVPSRQGNVLLQAATEANPTQGFGNVVKAR